LARSHFALVFIELSRRPDESNRSSLVAASCHCESAVKDSASLSWFAGESSHFFTSTP
jgi:hypothetical protein